MIENTLIVTGKGHETIRGYCTNRLAFEEILAVPVEASISGEDEWKLKHWGCLDNGITDIPQTSNGKFIVSFVTDAPPIPLFRALVMRFPYLRLTLYSVDTRKGLRSVLSAKKGHIYKESYRTDPPAWTTTQKT